MLQQALTIYKERIPGYILERSILTVQENAPPPIDMKPYETEEEARFRTQLLTLSMLKSPERCLAGTDYRLGRRVSFSQLQTILQDYQYIRLLRNMVNHAGEGDGGERNKMMEYLASESYQYKQTDRAEARDIRKALERGLEHLKACG